MNTVLSHFKRLMTLQQRDSGDNAVLEDLNVLQSIASKLSKSSQEKVNILIQELESQIGQDLSFDIVQSYNDMLDAMFKDPNLVDKLQLHMHYETKSSKNSSGGYDIIVQYDFTGVYGEMLSAIEDGDYIAFNFSATSKQDLPVLSLEDRQSWHNAILV